MKSFAVLPVFVVILVTSTTYGFNLFSLKKEQFLNRGRLHEIAKDIKDHVENGVLHMEQEVEDKVSPALWQHLFNTMGDKNKKAGGNFKLLQGSFKWASCGPKDQLMNVRSLSLQPDPLYFPGDLKLSFNIEFRHTISSDPSLTGTLYLELESGSNWIKIPCLGNIGSCTYKDVCSMLQPIAACPDPFVTDKIPCKCPFSKGDYELDNFNIEIDASVFLPGNYRGKVTLTNMQGQLACYQLSFTIG